MPSLKRIEELSPWALRPTIRAEVVYPTSAVEIPSLLTAPAGGVLATGAMCSYGDACVNEGGTHLSIRGLNEIFGFDTTTGRLTCGGGATLRSVLERVVPEGWFFPVVPGTMMTTVGGAIACDVHGKSHHRHGSFSTELVSFELIPADGETRLCSREQNAELFWATIGGLGQTGVISRATCQLSRIESAYISMQHFRTRNLEETLAMCGSQDDDFSVCWIDSLARGRDLGRGVLMVGHHASAAEVAEIGPHTKPFASPPVLPLSVPFFPPAILSRTPIWRAFNSAYYGLQARHPAHRLIHFRPYFFPLDRVAHWNRIYGRPGFLEYQFAVPLPAAEFVCREVLERLSASGNGVWGQRRRATSRFRSRA
jgi:decaprenylphospho-beta-D-ribofuranose 2-oxidase